MPNDFSVQKAQLYSKDYHGISIMPKGNNPLGPFYKHFTIPAWISNYIQLKMCGEITYPFPSFNSFTVEVWEMDK